MSTDRATEARAGAACAPLPAWLKRGAVVEVRPHDDGNSDDGADADDGNNVGGRAASAPAGGPRAVWESGTVTGVQRVRGTLRVAHFRSGATYALRRVSVRHVQSGALYAPPNDCDADTADDKVVIGDKPEDGSEQPDNGATPRSARNATSRATHKSTAGERGQTSRACSGATTASSSSSSPPVPNVANKSQALTERWRRTAATLSTTLQTSDFDELAPLLRTDARSNSARFSIGALAEHDIFDYLAATARAFIARLCAVTTASSSPPPPYRCDVWTSDARAIAPAGTTLPLPLFTEMLSTVTYLGDATEAGTEELFGVALEHADFVPAVHEFALCVMAAAAQLLTAADADSAYRDGGDDDNNANNGGEEGGGGGDASDQDVEQLFATAVALDDATNTDGNSARAESPTRHALVAAMNCVTALNNLVEQSATLHGGKYRRHAHSMTQRLVRGAMRGTTGGGGGGGDNDNNGDTDNNSHSKAGADALTLLRRHLSVTLDYYQSIVRVSAAAAADRAASRDIAASARPRGSTQQQQRSQRDGGGGTSAYECVPESAFVEVHEHAVQIFGALRTDGSGDSDTDEKNNIQCGRDARVRDALFADRRMLTLLVDAFDGRIERVRRCKSTRVMREAGIELVPLPRVVHDVLAHDSDARTPRVAQQRLHACNTGAGVPKRRRHASGKLAAAAADGDGDDDGDDDDPVGDGASFARWAHRSAVTALRTALHVHRGSARDLPTQPLVPALLTLLHVYTAVPGELEAALGGDAELSDELCAALASTLQVCAPVIDSLELDQQHSDDDSDDDENHNRDRDRDHNDDNGEGTGDHSSGDGAEARARTDAGDDEHEASNSADGAIDTGGRGERSDNELDPVTYGRELFIAAVMALIGCCCCCRNCSDAHLPSTSSPFSSSSSLPLWSHGAHRCSPRNGGDPGTDPTRAADDALDADGGDSADVVLPALLRDCTAFRGSRGAEKLLTVLRRLPTVVSYRCAQRALDGAHVTSIAVRARFVAAAATFERAVAATATATGVTRTRTAHFAQKSQQKRWQQRRRHEEENATTWPSSSSSHLAARVSPPTVSSTTATPKSARLPPLSFAGVPALDFGERTAHTLLDARKRLAQDKLARVVDPAERERDALATSDQNDDADHARRHKSVRGGGGGGGGDNVDSVADALRDAEDASPTARYTELRANHYMVSLNDRIRRAARQADICQCVSACTQAASCLNRSVFVECNAESCPVCRSRRSGNCGNLRFQRREYADCHVFRDDNNDDNNDDKNDHNNNINDTGDARRERVTARGRGCGVQTRHALRQGEFVVEYMGDVIDHEMLVQRRREYRGERHVYFMTLADGLYLDASRRATWARFINHSCEPNCYTEKWTVRGRPRVGIFAARDISVGEELSFDYRMERGGASGGDGENSANDDDDDDDDHNDAIDNIGNGGDDDDNDRDDDDEDAPAPIRCRCGTPRCTGWIIGAKRGGKPSAEEERALLRRDADKHAALVKQLCAEVASVRDELAHVTLDSDRAADARAPRPADARGARADATRARDDTDNGGPTPAAHSTRSPPPARARDTGMPAVPRKRADGGEAANGAPRGNSVPAVPRRRQRPGTAPSATPAAVAAPSASARASSHSALRADDAHDRHRRRDSHVSPARAPSPSFASSCARAPTAAPFGSAPAGAAATAAAAATPVTCYHCQQPGHIRRQCPWRHLTAERAAMQQREAHYQRRAAAYEEYKRARVAATAAAATQHGRHGSVPTDHDGDVAAAHDAAARNAQPDDSAGGSTPVMPTALAPRGARDDAYAAARPTTVGGGGDGGDDADDDGYASDFSVGQPRDEW